MKLRTLKWVAIVLVLAIVLVWSGLATWTENLDGAPAPAPIPGTIVLGAGVEMFTNSSHRATTYLQIGQAQAGQDLLLLALQGDVVLTRQNPLYVGSMAALFSFDVCPDQQPSVAPGYSSLSPGCRGVGTQVVETWGSSVSKTVDINLGLVPIKAGEWFVVIIDVSAGSIWGPAAPCHAESQVTAIAEVAA